MHSTQHSRTSFVSGSNITIFGFANGSLLGWCLSSIVLLNDSPSLSYTTFLRRWHQKWGLVLKFRDQSTFSQCDVCSELKAQLLSGNVKPFLDFLLGLKLCVWCCATVTFSWDFKTRTSTWISDLEHYDCTGNTWLTNILIDVRFGAWRTFHQNKCHAHALSWRTVLIKMLTLALRFTFGCFF